MTQQINFTNEQTGEYNPSKVSRIEKFYMDNELKILTILWIIAVILLVLLDVLMYTYLLGSLLYLLVGYFDMALAGLIYGVSCGGLAFLISRAFGGVHQRINSLTQSS